MAKNEVMLLNQNGLAAYGKIADEDLQHMDKEAFYSLQNELNELDPTEIDKLRNEANKVLKANGLAPLVWPFSEDLKAEIRKQKAVDGLLLTFIDPKTI